MANEGSSSAALGEREYELVLGLNESDSGWVEARTHCDHLLSALSVSDLSHIPPPYYPCTRCEHPTENWLCLSCKDVLCGRFINRHMLEHFQKTDHCLALSFSDLSVWCFKCDAYLDAQAILPLQPVYEIAHLLKFGESPPVRTLEEPPTA
ncbi:hypothetical protein H6P81_020431 [Aristolochia fimbriata]|uniref:UBP-type domain-containing protein n=1 Tax=Aristolochia fimbriata TaxID=158543 RepID=A0AAV7DXE8_ARIFI|nr:hypothetical protein H6P81_020431 [Aristolochia fimbriata]